MIGIDRKLDIKQLLYCIIYIYNLKNRQKSVCWKMYGPMDHRQAHEEMKQSWKPKGPGIKPVAVRHVVKPGSAACNPT